MFVRHACAINRRTHGMWHYTCVHVRAALFRSACQDMAGADVKTKESLAATTLTDPTQLQAHGLRVAEGEPIC